MTGPFGDEVQMTYVQKGELALFEVADLVGLAKIPIEKRNPLKIQTKGIWSTDPLFNRTRNERDLYRSWWDIQ